MSRFSAMAALFGVAVLGLSGCGNGGSGGGAAPVARSFTAVLSQNMAPQAEDSKVLATRRESGEIQFQFQGGALADMIVICADHSGAECRVVGGLEGTLREARQEGRMAGRYAYAGSLKLSHVRNGVIEHSFHRMYQALPGQEGVPQLPAGVQDYQGDFMAGALVGGEGGIAEGAVHLTANFDSGTLSGAFAGGMRDTGTPVAASFNNVTVDPGTGQFASGAGSSFSFNGASAGGVVQGGFYGPQAQEAAGAFEIGAGNDGMSGIFLACTPPQPNCVSHSN